MKIRFLPILCLLLSGCASVGPPTGLLGAYRLDDGTTASIRPSADDTLRYRIYESGASGRLYPESDGSWVSGDGFARREPVKLVVRFNTDDSQVAGSLELSYRDGQTHRAQRIGRERTVSFLSDDTKLFGRLHLPDGPPPYPAVVLVHGSGDSPGTEWLFDSDFFVANGIAVFTYDKRGTGRSAGSFTFDFQQLARDAVAAVDFVAAVSEVQPDRIGLVGYSQGAWVAPLAASLSDAVRYVIVNYGMIESPAEEAQMEMRQLLVDAGISGDDLQAGDQLIRAAVNLVASEFESGWPEFQALKKKYRHAPWIHHLDGTPVGQLMLLPKFVVSMIGKGRLPKDLPWRYDSTQLLESADIPMVWLLAGADRSAPNTQTIRKLQSLARAGKPIELIVFPNADHGMLTFEQGDTGRIYTGYAPGYFPAQIEAAKRLAGVRTGNAVESTAAP